MKNAEQVIGNIIDHQNISFIGSIDEDGFPSIKAMLLPRKREGIKTFYFSTNTSSMKIEQFRANSKACIYFYDRRFFKGVMFTGTIEVLEDDFHKHMLWQQNDTMYYKLGVTDPDYCVLRFTASKCRFYSNFNSQSFNIE